MFETAVVELIGLVILHPLGDAYMRLTSAGPILLDLIEWINVRRQQDTETARHTAGEVWTC